MTWEAVIWTQFLDWIMVRFRLRMNESHIRVEELWSGKSRWFRDFFESSKGKSQSLKDELSFFFVFQKTFLERHGKTALQYPPKQLR